MFHWFDTVTNTRGDALPGWQIECVLASDGQTVVPIFADENSTPIVTVSGVADRSVADENGNYYFFVPSGTYSLRFYDAAGRFQRLQRYITMYGEDYATQSIASAAASAEAAEEAATIAQAITGPLYASTAAGLAATTDGDEFAVDNGDGTAAIYFNDGGTAAFSRTIIIDPSANGTAALIGTASGDDLQTILDALDARITALEP